MKISLIIPTLNASDCLDDLFSVLKKQSVKLDEIVVIDSESDDDTVKKAESLGARIIQIKRKEFDHGKTRDLALRACEGDIVLFLTQDAMPLNEKYVENLLKPFNDEKVAIASGRQIPKDDANDYERLIREFNYPVKSNVRDMSDIPRLGIKTFFFSDACSAYRKNIYEQLGGFDFPILTDEDLFYAVKVVKNGYKVAYVADACVKHSHNLTLRQQYERNYVQGLEFKNHRQALEGISLESEGIKLVKYVTKRLINEGKWMSIIPFYFDCAARLFGSRAGRK